MGNTLTYLTWKNGSHLSYPRFLNLFIERLRFLVLITWLMKTENNKKLSLNHIVIAIFIITRFIDAKLPIEPSFAQSILVLSYVLTEYKATLHNAYGILRNLVGWFNSLSKAYSTVNIWRKTKLNKLPCQGKSLIRIFLHNTAALFDMESKLRKCGRCYIISFYEQF